MAFKQCSVGIKCSNVCQKIFPTPLYHHQQPELNTKRGWHRLMLFTPNSDPANCISHAVQFWWDSCIPVVRWQEWTPLWSYAAVAHLSFWDAPLHGTIVKSGNLTYCCLPVSLNQSTHSPLTSLINKVFSPVDLPLSRCCSSQHCLYTLDTVVCENPRISAVSEILSPACLAPTIIPQWKSLRSYFILILTSCLMWQLTS